MRVDTVNGWGWRNPLRLSFVVNVAGCVIRRAEHGAQAFGKELRQQGRAGSPVVDAFKYSTPDMLRVVCMALMNVIPVVATIFGAAYAVQPAYGVGFAKDVYLWIPVVGNIVAVLVIPYVGDLSDRIGRKPPIILGSLLAGLFAFAYLYAISIKNVPFAFVMSLLMWGVVYQGYNAVFPSFYPELFPTRIRGRAMAISTVALWVACTALTLTFLSLVDAIGISGAFWLYASICLFTLFFVWIAVPETKGKTLEEIERSWRR